MQRHNCSIFDEESIERSSVLRCLTLITSATLRRREDLGSRERRTPTLALIEVSDVRDGTSSPPPNQKVWRSWWDETRPDARGSVTKWEDSSTTQPWPASPNAACCLVIMGCGSHFSVNYGFHYSSMKTPIQRSRSLGARRDLRLRRRRAVRSGAEHEQSTRGARPEHDQSTSLDRHRDLLRSAIQRFAVRARRTAGAAGGAVPSRSPARRYRRVEEIARRPRQQPRTSYDRLRTTTTGGDDGGPAGPQAAPAP